MKVKLASMKADQERVQKLHALRHSRHVLTDDKLAADVGGLCDEWAQVLAQLGQCLGLLC